MDIYLDKLAVKQIKASTDVAIEEGDVDTLREDIVSAFTDEQIAEIERRVDSGDFHDFLSEMLDEWSGSDVDELFELLQSGLIDVGVDLKFARAAGASDDDDEDEPEDLDDDDEVDEELDAGDSDDDVL